MNCKTRIGTHTDNEIQMHGKTMIKRAHVALKGTKAHVRSLVLLKLQDVQPLQTSTKNAAQKNGVY